MKTININQPQQRLSLPRAAIFFTVLFVFFAFVVVGGIYRVFQFWPELLRQLNVTYYSSQIVTAHRGNIWDRGGRPLAMNADQYHATADLNVMRSVYTNPESVINERLLDVLEMPSDAAQQKLTSARDFVYLKKEIPPWKAQALRELKIKGIGSHYQSQRFYPNGEIVAHLIGHTDYKGVGRGGIENMQQQHLSPQDGEVKLLRTSRGESLQELDYKPAQNGGDSYLTIDSRLQFFTYQALREAAARHDAKAGAAVVMDVESGGLLALVNYPSFNPNHILKMNEQLRNRAVSDVVEPGSTAKPFVVALALENKKTKAKEILPTVKPVRIGRLTVRDKHIRELLDVEGVIRESSNLGAVELATRVGKESLWEFYDALGFGNNKVLDLPEENTGLLRPHDKWRREDFATHAYGYGFSTSLLQLLRAYTVFARDGEVVNPVLEKGQVGYREQVLSPPIARQVRTMMESVATIDGTAQRAAIAGYRVAGKTGTVFKVHNGAYDSDKIRAYFVGMVPASSPRYLMAVMIDEPQQNGVSGGAAAAPVFQQVMRRLLLMNGIAPDGEMEAHA